MTLSSILISEELDVSHPLKEINVNKAKNSFKNLKVSFREFKDGFLKLSDELGMEIWVQKKEIFDKMHTI